MEVAAEDKQYCQDTAENSGNPLGEPSDRRYSVPCQGGGRPVGRVLRASRHLGIRKHCTGPHHIVKHMRHHNVPSHVARYLRYYRIRGWTRKCTCHSVSHRSCDLGYTSQRIARLCADTDDLKRQMSVVEANITSLNEEIDELHRLRQEDQALIQILMDKHQSTSGAP